MKNCIGRQCIYNRLKQKVAYECLYRNNPDSNACKMQVMGSIITSNLLSECAYIGYDKVLGSKVGFFNVTEDILEDIDTYNIPEGSVLELIAIDYLSEDLNETIKAVKRKGYKIALDDFNYCQQSSPLIASADVIKIDYLDCTREEINLLVKELRKSAKVLLAEKVESLEDYEHALNLGFDLFQGYFFDKPEIISSEYDHLS